MTVKSFIKKTLNNSCIFFSAIMLAYIICAAIANVGGDALLLDAERTVLFYFFSLLLSFANALFLLQRLKSGVKILLHYVIVLFAFYTCFMLPLSMRASSVIIGIVLFTVLYFAITGIIAAVRSRYRSKLEKTQEYKKQY